MAKSRTKQGSKADLSARERIIGEARHRFASSGFEGASTRQIAQDAGVAQSLLLYHFGSKEVLWKAMMDDTFYRAGQVAAEAARGFEQATVKERLLIAVRAFIQMCNEMPDLHRLMTIEGRSKSTRLIWLADKHLKPTFTRSVALIEEAQQQGIVKPGDPALIHYGIIAIAGMAYAFAPEISLMTGRSRNPDPTEVERLVRAFLFTQE